MRQRYFVVASVAYMILGFIIVVRSIMSHVFIVGILGVIFIALGAVRLRDYFSRKDVQSGT